MKTENNPRHQDIVRDQFTRTAEIFGSYAVAHRVGDAELLALMVHASRSDRAVDLATGPGTLALRFASQVRWICGLDLTPAILERGKRSAAEQGLSNLNFAIGDANALPFAEGALDIAVTSFSLHHMPDPARVIGEMARVVKRGGRVGVLDIYVPEDPRVAETSNRIERFRDASHTRTLARSEFKSIFAASGLRVTASEVRDDQDSFDHWLLRGGKKRGDAGYDAARQLLETTFADDSAGFHPRFAPLAPGEIGSIPDIQIVHTKFYIAGEKL
jgi:ubiquinone/menaquinone biosynthesis C-methylase UbiE